MKKKITKKRKLELLNNLLVLKKQKDDIEKESFALSEREDDVSTKRSDVVTELLQGSDWTAFEPVVYKSHIFHLSRDFGNTTFEVKKVTRTR